MRTRFWKRLFGIGEAETASTVYHARARSTQAPHADALKSDDTRTQDRATDVVQERDAEEALPWIDPGPFTPSPAHNLDRWRRSGLPRRWVERHDGKWTRSDWQGLVESLKKTDFWPLEPDDIGGVLEEQKRLLAEEKRQLIKSARPHRRRSAREQKRPGVKRGTTRNETVAALANETQPSAKIAVAGLGDALILLAAEKGDLQQVKVLLKNNPALIFSKAIDGGTPLHPAATHGHKDVVKLLLETNSEVNAKSNKGYTPLHCAALNGHEDVVKLLIHHKAVVNIKDTEFVWTPLHWASGGGHTNVVKLLLENNSEVNAKDNSGRTPLQLALATGKMDVAELLRRHGGHE
jgi:hypothetical protein